MGALGLLVYFDRKQLRTENRTCGLHVGRIGGYPLGYRGDG